MRLLFLIISSTLLLACGSKQSSFHKFDKYIQAAQAGDATAGASNESGDAEAAETVAGSMEDSSSVAVDIEIIESGLSDSDLDAKMDADSVIAGASSDDSASDVESDPTAIDGKNNKVDRRGGKHKTASTANRMILWPPNHKMVLMKLTPLAETENLNDCKIESISSSEALGDDSYDHKIIDATTFALRAEREGKNKDGRTYSLAISCLDGEKSPVAVEHKVLVPHNLSQIK